MKKILWIILIIGVIAGVYVWFFKKEKPELAGGVLPEQTGMPKIGLPDPELYPVSGLFPSILKPVLSSEVVAVSSVRTFIQEEITQGKGFIVPVIERRIKPDVTLTPQIVSPFFQKLGL